MKLLITYWLSNQGAITSFGANYMDVYEALTNAVAAANNMAGSVIVFKKIGKTSR